MDMIFIIPGALLSLLILIAVIRRFKLIKLPRIKLKKPHINAQKKDDLIRELGLIAFFCMLYVSIRGYDWRIAGIICGLMGIWFFYPRK